MIRTTIAFWTLFGNLLLFCSCSFSQQARAEDSSTLRAWQVGVFRNGHVFHRNLPDVNARRSHEGSYPPEVEPLRISERFNPGPPERAVATPSPQVRRSITDHVDRKGRTDSSIEPRRDEPSKHQLTPSRRPDFELSSEMLDLRDRLRNCLVYYFDRLENASNRSPWAIMHTLIAYGVDTEIYANGQKVNAIGWLCFNGSGRGQRLFYLSGNRLHAAEGAGLQGHPGQFLAMLAQCRVQRDYPIKVDGRDFTVEDLIEYEKRTCRPATELTFKLIGLSHYLDSDDTWQDDYGQEWNISRLIKEELAQPIIGATCGGTHRMTGFSYSVQRRKKQGKEVSGQFLRAQKYVEAYHDYTLSLQNPDGSFSTNWFEGRGDWGGLDKRLQTTGHILEWLMLSLPDEQLLDPRVVKAVNYLTDLLGNNRNMSWEIGPRGHALHALVLYDQRVFGARPGQGGPKLVQSANPAAAEE